MALSLPPPGPARSLCLQSALYATGSGVFLAGNAVFFTQVVGLTPQQVGVGLSVASLVSLVLAVPLGRVADHLGPLRTWVAAAAVEACLYLAYPLVHGMSGFLAVVAALALVESVGGAGRSAYTYAAVTGADRTRSLAFIRTALNIGFTVGALVGGLALGIGTSWALRGIPVAAATLMAVNTIMLMRLPRVQYAARESMSRNPFHALGDLPFVVTSTLNGGVGGLHGVIGMTVLPLWLVTRTDAPRALTAWLFALNTVMAVGLQVWATRGVGDVPTAARATRRACAVLALACVAVMVTPGRSAWVAAVLLTAAMALATMAELWQSAGAWQLMGDLAPAARRGEYAGVARLGTQSVQAGAPAAITWLTMTWRPAGWLVVAAVVLGAGVLVGPAARWAERTPRASWRPSRSARAAETR